MYANIQCQYLAPLTSTKYTFRACLFCVFYFYFFLLIIFLYNLMPSLQSHLKRRYFVGSLALSAVIFIWVASSFAMNVTVACVD